MMQMKSYALPVLVFIMALLQINTALARGDDLIKNEIVQKISETTETQNTSIKVLVDQRLVVLSGRVRLYEQKLIADRIAWTTVGVFEVDNELQVVPKIPLADTGIEKKIKMLIKSDQQFIVSGITVQVINGEVILSGIFADFRAPSRLKHKVAEIEGVVNIKMHVSFVS